MGEKIRVGIVFGGKSAEHEVSIQSAKCVIDSIDTSRFEPVLIGIDKDGQWLLNDHSLPLLEGGIELPLLSDNEPNSLIKLPLRDQLAGLDIVFPVLHGPLGEDGTIQGLLKLANLPFVGAGVLGSAIGMDKDVMKRLLREAGIPIADFICVQKPDAAALDYSRIKDDLGSRLFIKPANLGSSVGVNKAINKIQFDEHVKTAFQFDTKIIIETSIKGREIECSVLGNYDPIASLPGEILPQHEFYSYHAKYIDENGAKLIIPAELDEQIVNRVQNISIKAYKVLGCSGMARVDMFLTENGEIIINELNTIPGFTKISMYPKLWEASGIGITELISKLIDLGFERHGYENKLNTSYGDL